MSVKAKSAYEPIDSIAGVPWSFLKLVCMEHGEERPEFRLTDSHSGPGYRCGCPDCKIFLPALVHEKLLDDAVKLLGDRKTAVGHSWRRQVMRHIYVFTLLAYEHESGAVIGVRQLN